MYMAAVFLSLKLATTGACFSRRLAVAPAEGLPVADGMLAGIRSFFQPPESVQIRSNI